MRPRQLGRAGPRSGRHTGWPLPETPSGTRPVGASTSPRCSAAGAPVVLEIGSGMGDATAAMAAADPDRDYLAVEVHTPGIANLLALVERARA